MRPRGVVVVGPRTKDLPGVIETEEQAFVQQLVPHPAVKTFAEPVLHRLARGNVVPGDAMLGTPGKDGVRRQLGAVVRHDHARLAAPFDQSGQFPSNPFAGDRRVGDRRQAFPRHIIDDIEDPKAPAAGKLSARWGLPLFNEKIKVTPVACTLYVVREMVASYLSMVAMRLAGQPDQRCFFYRRRGR